MTDSTIYRTNRDLFSNHYLNDHLRETEPWNEVPDAEVEAAFQEIDDLLDEKRDRVDDYNEAQLERNLIRPIFKILEIPFEIEETVMRNARRPDYGFFPGEDAADGAFDRENFYEEAIAVADAKRWGRKLDTRGKEKRDFENPSYQIHRYLQETPTQWAVLTNGEKWRLYYGPTSHRLDSYYEIDLPELLDVVESESDLEAFKEFYLFFRQEAFLPDQTGDCFLDDVYDESSVFAEELGEDLQENIYEAIRVLAEGFLDTNDDLDEDDLGLIHDSSLIYLYRLIFVLYAESEGRDLLPTDNEIYSGSYSLNELKLEVVENRDATQQHYQTWQTDLWDQLDELFVLIDQGSRGKGISKDDLYIPAYNGGLFRTNPDEDDSVESQFLSNYEVGDAYLAEVIELLTRHEASEGEGRVFVDYSSLDERNLGSIYEGLLEYKLDVADEPLTIDDGAYTPAGEDDDITVESGEVYLQTDDGERKATGSYYTPEYVVEYIVDETLGPLVQEIRADLMSQSADTTHSREGGFADEFADRIFDLTVLDPAMGSGHFPVNAVDYLARKIIDAQEKQDRQAIDAEDAEMRAPTTREGELRDINWARRKVAQRCIYGVDVNPLATELSKVSLWLRTLAAEQPLAFLDHHLKTGNSLVGSDIEDVLTDGDDDTTGDGQLTLQQSFDHTRQRAMEHVTDRFQDLLNIDNETLEDAKEMEAVYDDVRDDPLYKKLLVMANVYTADAFGLDVPGDADERMARALHNESWENIEEQDWFKSAQAMAEEEGFFHWELEFPMAFYNQDGERKADAGFDAVIGNPPYVSAWNRDLGQDDFFRRNYHSASGHYDLYCLFIEKGVDLLQQSGGISLIIPDTLCGQAYAENCREILTEELNLKSVVDMRGREVFKGISVENIIFSARGAQQKDEKVNVKNVGENSISEFDFSHTFPSELLSKENEYRIPLSKGSLNIGIREKINAGTKLTDVFYISKGMEPHTADGRSKYDFIKKDDSSNELEPYIEGKHIGRWLIHSEWSIDYSPNEHKAPAFREMFESRKVVGGRTIGEGRPMFSVDEKGYYNNEKVLNAVPYSELQKVAESLSQVSIDDQGAKNSKRISLYAVTSILNSALTAFVFREIESGALDFFPRHLKKIQIPIPESVPEYANEPAGIQNPRDEISSDDTVRLYEQLHVLGYRMSKTHRKRAKVNVDILDYLGNYEEGPDLPDIGIFQPANPEYLDNTADDYEKLQIERARTKRDGPSVTIEATARYKPEDEDEFETDTYGYTETEFVEAFTLTNLSEEKAALVEGFVPVAVDEEIANFSDNATKNISLLDRLKAMTLPDLDDVEDDLRRYVENREQADDLDDEIEKTDQLIDEVVYDLYDLTDEEIEIVEDAVT